MNMKTISSDDYFKTDDTSLAAYLYCMGFRIIEIDYSNTRAKIFFSKNSPKIHEHEQLYYTDKATITPATYSRIHKRLSTVIRRQLPWQEGIINA